MLRLTFAASLVVALAAPALGQSAPTGLTVLERMDVPEAVHRATTASALPAATALHLSIALAPRDAEGLEAFVDSVSDPRSPNYRRYLTPAQVGQRFGVSSARLQAIQTYLKGQGMKVVLVPDNRLSILVDATAAQAERAFDVRLARFRAVARRATDRPEFFANTETPKLPSSFASSVVNIGGLDNATQPVPRMALTPVQTQALYKAASLSSGGFRGQGRTIAISNFDGFRLSNVPLYYKQYGLPAPAGGVGSNVRVVTVGTGAQNGTVQGEGDLDIQMVLGMAPLCNFTIYDSANDLIGVLSREVNDNTADIISESYGWRLPASTATAAHNLHLSMSAQGITYLAASGDSGTNFNGYDYPDFEPEVLQVGGTIANVDANGNRTNEVGWSGSGGGYSANTAAFNVLPSWQKGNGVPTDINKRLVPDVALHASGGNSGAYPFFYNGTLTTGYVGTSFACPVMAGMLGIAQQKLDTLGYFKTGTKRFGRLQDLIYAQNGRADVWTDIVSGANGNLLNGTPSTAHAGWDSVTGWGAMNVEGFVAALAPAVAGPTVYSPSTISVYNREGTVASGDLASLTSVDGNLLTLSSNAPTAGDSFAGITANFALPAGKTGSATITIVAFGNPDTREQLGVFNYRKGVYDLLLNSPLSVAGSTFKVSLVNVADYLSPSGGMTMNARTRSASRTHIQKTDQLIVTLP